MDEKIKAFIDSLRKYLEGMPQEEIGEAVSYYEEYLFDALEEGKDIDAILDHLGSPRMIAALIRTEASIARARKAPGLRNYTRVLGNSFHIVTTPLAVFMMTLFVVISFSFVVSFFIVSFAALAAGIVFVLGLVYQAFTGSSFNMMDVIGAIGIGLFGAGVLLLISYLFFKLARLSIDISTWLIRRITRKPGRFVPDAGDMEEKRKTRWKRAVFVCTVLLGSGLILASVSGLPLKYFLIFNSMKPQNLTVKTEEFDTAKTDKISLTTTHTNIRIVSGTGNKVIVTFEKPDWLDQELSAAGDGLIFKENSNGKLPLFQLAQLHENSAEVTVSLPRGYSPKEVDITSYGGSIRLEALADNIKVSTVSGYIYINKMNPEDSYNLKASTGSGAIVAEGSQAPRRTDNGLELETNTGANKYIVLHSASGSITINR